MGKAIKNVRKHKDIKLFTTVKGRNYLVSVPKTLYYKVFQRKFISIRNEKITDIHKWNCLFRALDTGIK